MVQVRRAANPEGTVVEIGVGLNTRFERLDNGRARWFELDLPEAMNLRRRFFADDVQTLEEWRPARLKLATSCILPNGPAVVLDLLPPETAAALPVMRQDPQATSYHLSMFTIES